MQSYVIKQDGKVFIDGVPKLGWGLGKENTLMGALQSTLNAIGNNITYEYLMGISGAAFRLHFHSHDSYKERSGMAK